MTTPIERDSVIFIACQCEHICHMETTARSPNGNPGHRYGVKFNNKLMVNVVTDYGVSRVCPDCAKDCHAEATVV